MYLVNYRDNLSNEEIKNLLSHPEQKWIDNINTPIVEYLCSKVAIEESIDTLDITNINEHCQCTKFLNQSLKAMNENNQQLAVDNIVQALTVADTKLTKYISTRRLNESIKNGSPIELDSTEEQQRHYYVHTLLELFDTFILYGRIFENKDVRDVIKLALNMGYNI